MLFTTRLRLDNSLSHAVWHEFLVICRRGELSILFYMTSRLASWRIVRNHFETETLGPLTNPNSVEYLYLPFYNRSRGCFFLPGGILYWSSSVELDKLSLIFQSYFILQSKLFIKLTLVTPNERWFKNDFLWVPSVVMKQPSTHT